MAQFPEPRDGVELQFDDPRMPNVFRKLGARKIVFYKDDVIAVDAQTQFTVHSIREADDWAGTIWVHMGKGGKEITVRN